MALELAPPSEPFYPREVTNPSENSSKTAVGAMAPWVGGRGRSPPPPSGGSGGAVIGRGGLQEVVERAVGDAERGVQLRMDQAVLKLRGYTSRLSVVEMRAQVRF